MREVVHEIGNPLTSMITTLQVLDEGMETFDINKKRQYVRRISNEIERLSTYLKKMRVFSVPDKQMEKESLHLASIIERVISKIKTITDNQNISVLQKVDPSLWILADENAFFQVLINLFLNSKGSLVGTGTIRIEAEKMHESFVKLIYKDSCLVIPGEMVDKLFMPFYRRGEECGIDIALSLKLMARMGGKMSVEVPGDGQGTAFVLYIPTGRNPS